MCIIRSIIAMTDWINMIITSGDLISWTPQSCPKMDCAGAQLIEAVILQPAAFTECMWNSHITASV